MENKSLLPSSIQDESNLAIEKCVVKALEGIDNTRFMTCVPERLDEEILSYLAESTHVLGYEGWMYAKTFDEKTQLLKNATSLHKKKGTVWAVKKCLDESANCKYIPWYEYNGIPHHFKLDVTLENSAYDWGLQRQLTNKISEYKQLRAQLDRYDIKQQMHMTFNPVVITRVETFKLSLADTAQVG